MSGPHPVPAAIDALVAADRADPTFADVRVDDGAAAFDQAAPDSIAIGLSVGEARGATGTSTVAWEGDLERHDIACAIQSWHGGVDVAGRRARAYALLDAQRAVLRTNPTLGGAVARARITRSVYRPAVSTTETIVLIEFVVTIDAIRTFDEE